MTSLGFQQPPILRAHAHSIPVIVVDVEGYFSWAKQIRVAVRNIYETSKYGSNNDIRDRS